MNIFTSQIFPTKFCLKFTTSFLSVRFDWQLGNEKVHSELRDFQNAFSSPEAALLLVSTKNRDLENLWPGPTLEVHDSRTSRHFAHAQSQVWQIWLVLVSIYCVYKAIQNRNVVGRGQRSRFLVLTKRSAASGDENVSNELRKPRVLTIWRENPEISVWSQMVR